MKENPTVAVLSFPGNNCEVESIRALKEVGINPLYFRWNDSRELRAEVDGYFIPGGFSYEDRGRSGMIAARDPLIDFIGQEAEDGKAVIGNCNGAQILVESGLVPLHKGLHMSLAHNAVPNGDTYDFPGFISEWVWITPSCAQDRCATSDWEGTMHVPIAHGEGRFTTKDPDVIRDLKENNQIAFSYCTADGFISSEPYSSPNGSLFDMAGICNPEGNVVALMPHPERTPSGRPYFESLKKWIEKGRVPMQELQTHGGTEQTYTETKKPTTELFIETIITNNEERTVEQAAKRIVPHIRIKQLRYMAISNDQINNTLSRVSMFNSNKERAYIRRENDYTVWIQGKEEPIAKPFDDSLLFVRTDKPTAPYVHTSVCYALSGLTEAEVKNQKLLEILRNPHSASLTLLR